MNKQEASALISEKLSAARRLLDECVEISDESEVAFILPWGGEGTSESGIGGTYVPARSDESNYHEYTGWNASSHSC